MKLKLDENFDVRLNELFLKNNCDVETVFYEGLSGSRDEIIYQACIDEKRTLITFDLDFSNPLRIPPQPTEGIIIVRPKRLLFSSVKASILNLLLILKSESPAGSLWIVEPNHYRIFDLKIE